METRLGASLVAVVFHSCEHFAFLQDEVEFIWSRPWRSRLSSWLFIFTRYSPYVFHILNNSFMEPIFAATDQQMSSYLTLMFKTISAQAIFLVVQFVLSKRLTLLYTGTWVRVFILPGLMIARISLVVYLGSVAYHTLIKQTRRIGPTGIMVIFSGGEALLELAMLGLMTIAYFTDVNTRHRNPITHRLRRGEGLGAPVFCLVAMGIALYMQICGPPLSLAIYPIYLDVMSALGCRLILSNHKIIQAFMEDDVPTPVYRLVDSRL